MKATFEEIVKAINVVRETCKEHKNCEGCPFDIDGECGFTDDCDPYQWQFDFDEEEEGTPLDKWQL